MVHFAKRVRSIEASPTVHIGDLIADMKARGEKVLSLAIGEPDFPTPAHIVAPTKHTLFMTCMALLDTGDEAIIPDPGWVSYAPMVTLAGARPVPVHAADDEGFVPAADAVAEAITPHTRLLMLNSPSNPAGSVYSRSETKALADLAADRDLVLKEIAKIDGLATYHPNGAFYVFPRFEAEIDSATLCERILKEASVAVTPGSAFGEAGEGHIRISYAASRDTILEGLRRIAEIIRGLSG